MVLWKLKSRTLLRTLTFHSSIDITGVSQCANVCPILTDLDSYFRNITAVAISAIVFVCVCQIELFHNAVF